MYSNEKKTHSFDSIQIQFTTKTEQIKKPKIKGNFLLFSKKSKSVTISKKKTDCF